MTSVSSVFAHPKHHIHEHGNTNNTDTSAVFDKNGLPCFFPNDLNNVDYQEILDEIIANGTTNFKTGETIATALQQDVDNKKG